MSVPDYKVLFESLPGMYLILTPELNIHGASDSYLKTAGKSREAIIGQRIEKIFPEANVVASGQGLTLVQVLESVIRDKKTKVTPYRRYDIVRPDGRTLVKYWGSKDIPLLDESKNVSCIIHFVEDITELIQSAELFSTIFELNPVCISLSKASDGTVTNVNRAFLKLFGFKNKEQVIGKTASELKVTTDENSRQKAIAALKAGHPIENVEGRLVFGDQVYWISSSVKIVEINHEEYLLSTLIDVTEKKKQDLLLQEQAFQLKQANEELETFSYSVSHDLKAPLRSLDGFSKLLIENYGGKLDEDGNRWLKFINDNASRMGVLINDILNFSRISRSSITKAEVNMKALVDKLYESEKQNYPDKVIELHLEDIPNCMGDYAMLTQVWQNLISNALKYSSKNDVIELYVSGSRNELENVYSIRDNGVGFDEKYKEKLFGVFQRLHRSEEFEGTGVGLAIVRRILLKHNGTIEAHSQIAQGSTFTFTIPI